MRRFVSTLVTLTLLAISSNLLSATPELEDAIAHEKEMQILFQQRAQNFRTEAKTPVEHLAEHKADKKACADFIAYLRKDKKFLEFFFSIPNQDKFDELKGTEYEKIPAIKYFMDNDTRVDIYADFHGLGRGSNYGEHFCDPATDVRLYKVEALGLSDEAWVLRKEELDLYLRHLAPPDDCVGGGTRFSYLYQDVKRAKKNYERHKSKEFRAWVQKAIAKVQTYRQKDGRPLPEGSCGESTEKVNQIVDSWLRDLRGLIA